MTKGTRGGFPPPGSPCLWQESPGGGTVYIHFRYGGRARFRGPFGSAPPLPLGPGSPSSGFSPIRSVFRRLCRWPTWAFLGPHLRLPAGPLRGPGCRPLRGPLSVGDRPQLIRNSAVGMLLASRCLWHGACIRGFLARFLSPRQKRKPPRPGGPRGQERHPQGGGVVSLSSKLARCHPQGAAEALHFNAVLPLRHDGDPDVRIPGAVLKMGAVHN